MVFNVLEALQPSLVSRVAPAAYKGLALGFYNTAQAAGLFTGGALGGWLASHSGANAVFIAAAAWRCSGWPLPGRCGRWPSSRGGGYARKSRNAPPSGANIRQIGGPQR